MNLPTNVNIMFYQFEIPYELVDDSPTLTWHVAPLSFMTVDLYLYNFMNLPNWFHKTFRTLWFLYSQLLTSSFRILFAFSLFIGSSLLCVNLETSSLHVDFSLAFHYSALKLEASSVHIFFGLWLLYIEASNTNPVSLESSILWIWLWEESWPCE